MPFESSPYSREIDLCMRLAREAGELAVKCRDGDLEVEMKAGDEPVTVADKMASDHIVAGLEQVFPNDVIISEENADDLRRLTANRVWYIDPIDGTKDFIRGEEGFCVMIGLVLDGRPRLGVIYQPTSKRSFAAAPDCGTWLYAPGEEPRRVRVSDTSDPAKARLVASKSHRDTKIDSVKSALGINNELNIGSVGLKLGLIAVGERDLYVNPSPRCKTWDTCGPEALLAEAGGLLTDINGQPLRYDDEDVGHPRGLLASNGKVHQAVVNKLDPLFPPDRPID
ncbi:MAG: 3'(2'),5'-bisphosphate nucleotidase CysQ [Deltaproteobacteria bacterium]|nr:3'(2'),5'-bisphosphate nucleotidase CysQ [Deltaproteobacteria bacterium]